MKKSKLLSVLPILILCVCLFFACDTNDGNDDKKPQVSSYTLTFDLDGGSMESSSVIADENTTVDLSGYVPRKENGAFKGWTLDGEIVTSVTVTADVTLKATWEILAEYEATADQSAYILTYVKGAENLVLPSTYDSKPVIGIKAGAIGNAAVVKRLVIGKSYSDVEDGTLAALKNLESLSVPFVKSNADFAKLFEKVETMPAGCYEVKVGSDVYAIPDSLVSLTITGGNAVLDLSYNKFKLKDLTVASDELAALEARTISENDYIESVDLGGCENLVEIEGSNFYNCVNLKNIDIGGLGKLEVIGEHCFYYYLPGTDNRWEVDSIDMSGLDSLKVVGQMCFWYVSTDTLDFSETAIEVFGRQSVFRCAVKNVKLSAMLNLNLTESQSEAYENQYQMPQLNNSEFLGYIDGLESITVDKASLFLSSENGALYDFDKTALIKYANNDATSYVAPDTLKTIGPTAFVNAKSLASVDLTACELESIGYGAFSVCSATLNVGFDRYGYYAATGSRVSLGNNWKGGCNVNYGSRYLFFSIDVKGISDNMTVATDSVDFTASATYGDDTANVVVKVNGVETEKGANGYTATLADGTNTIEIIATFAGKTSDVMTYTVNKSSKWTLKTSLADGQKVVWANGNLTFNVWAENAEGVKQEIENLVKIYLDCGYSTSFVAPLDGIGVTYSDKVATVVVDSETLLRGDYDVTKEHHIKVEIEQSAGIAVDKVFDARYYENAPELVSETPTSGNTVSDDWTIELQCVIGSSAQKISSITAELNIYGSFTENGYLTATLSSDNTVANVNFAVSNMIGWLFDGDSFKIKVTVTLENGLTTEIIFDATYIE